MLVTEQNRAEVIRELQTLGYVVQKTVPPGDGDIPDRQLYRPYVNDWCPYSPWTDHPELESVVAGLIQSGSTSLVGRDRFWVLHSLCRHVAALEGEVWEAGVYQGGTARLFRTVLERLPGPWRLRLFDTFAGMPRTREDQDSHKEGDFADTNLALVQRAVGPSDCVEFRPGFVPDTFRGLEDCRIKLAHVDLDIYESIKAACQFIYPRMVAGGVMVFDDYGFWSCPGPRKAVDEFFSDKPEVPLCLPTCQAVVTVLPRTRPQQPALWRWLRRLVGSPNAKRERDEVVA